MERNGKPYCALHDPERVRAKLADREAQYAQSRKAQDARRALHRVKVKACVEAITRGLSPLVRHRAAVTAALRAAHTLARLARRG